MCKRCSFPAQVNLEQDQANFFAPCHLCYKAVEVDTSFKAREVTSVLPGILASITLTLNWHQAELV